MSNTRNANEAKTDYSSNISKEVESTGQESEEMQIPEKVLFVWLIKTSSSLPFSCLYPIIITDITMILI